jgi:FkbM family methyltransferase
MSARRGASTSASTTEDGPATASRPPGYPPLIEVRVGRHSFRVVDDEFAAFWERVTDGDWEPHSFAVIDHFVSSGLTFVDIGAWIGPLSLYAAHLTDRCHAIEPDGRARACLEANIALNPPLAERIVVHPVAIAERPGVARLGSITSAVGGDSMSSLLFGDADASWPVECVTLEAFVGTLPPGPLGLVKIDIEGYEVSVLEGSRSYLAASHPPLYLSVHASFWDEPRPTMERLLDLLSTYRELLTPALEPIAPDDLLDDDHLSGLFELVAV